MTDVDSDDFEQSEEMEVQPWSWTRLAGILVTAAGNVVRSVAVACDEVSEAVASHELWVRQRGEASEFASDVMKDLASLPTSS